MGQSQILPGVLAFVLLIGGFLLVLQVLRERRKIIAVRVAFVAPQSFAVATAGDYSARSDAALLRMSVSGLRDSDLAEIGRICNSLGISAANTLAAFAALRLSLGTVFGIGGLFLLRWLDLSGLMAIAGMLLAPAAVVLGWYLPLRLVRTQVRSRASSVTSGLPEALELLVICVEAGLALEDGLDRITGELYKTQPALAEELETTSADLKILPDRDEAFRKLADRVDSPSIRTVVTTLSQTLRYGTPLAGALRTASAQMRSDSLVALEERANRLPTLMTLPMIFFIMPTIFLIVGGPAVLRLMDLFASRS